MAAPERTAPARRTRSFGVTVLLGLAGAALAAVAGSRTWAEGRGSAAGIRVTAAVDGSDVAPLVTALALVSLAAWGAVLVTRGRFRRVVGCVGLASSVAVAVAVALAFGSSRDAVVAALADKGATGDVAAGGPSAWYYLAGVAAVVAAGAFAVAVRAAPGWPAMSSRYDAPGGRPPSSEDAERDMWRALDEGRDPTS